MDDSLIRYRIGGRNHSSNCWIVLRDAKSYASHSSRFLRHCVLAGLHLAFVRSGDVDQLHQTGTDDCGHTCEAKPRGSCPLALVLVAERSGNTVAMYTPCSS